MLQFALSIRCLVLTVSRWQPVVTLGRPLFISNIVSWHLCLIKASCITWPVMISTMLIIFSQTVVFPHFSNSTHRATLNNKQDNPELLKFKPKHYMKMENSTNQLETWWTLHLGLVEGEHYLFFPLVHVSLSDVIIVLVEFTLENMLFIQLSHSLLCPFSQFWLAKKSGWWSQNWAHHPQTFNI